MFTSRITLSAICLTAALCFASIPAHAQRGRSADENKKEKRSEGRSEQVRKRQEQKEVSAKQERNRENRSSLKTERSSRNGQPTESRNRPTRDIQSAEKGRPSRDVQRSESRNRPVTQENPRQKKENSHRNNSIAKNNYREVAARNSHIETRRIGHRDVKVNVNVHNYNTHVNVLPPKCKPMVYHGVRYHHHNGIYYRPWGNTYVICRPPVGAVIASTVVAATLTAITVGVINAANAQAQPARHPDYFYDDGNYYVKKGSNYDVVEPPLGAIVPALPSGCEELILENNTYYRVDDSYYKPYGNSDFMVVGKIVR